MLTNLLLGLATMVICLLLQALIIVAAVRYYYAREYLVNNPSFWSSLSVIKGVLLLLVVGNLVQMAIWAWLFLFLEEFQQFGAAFYHSAVNFATLGYGDVVMSEKYKLLGPLEALNGVLMIGVSTAILMATFQDTIQKTLKARHD